MNKITVAAATMAAMVAFSAQAKVSTEREYAGYNTCLDAAAEEHLGLVPSRVYYYARKDDRNIYYINATAWEDGQRVPVRVSCDTSRNGLSLLSQTSAYGRFAVNEEQQTIQVATQ